MDHIIGMAKQLQEEIVANRRYIHENAEIHTDLPITTAFVKQKLTEMGYEPIEITKGGIVAIAGKKPGKTFLIRGDMDALPMAEETDLPFKSKTPYMHSCGHDMHTAMMLGAAKILKQNEDKLEGQVKLMFQPAEETLVGAKAMIDADLLENPKVDAAMMIHVRIDDMYDTGSVMFTKPGVSSSSADGFRIDIKGRGGHGSRPQDCLDPLTTAAYTLIGLQEINAREIGSSDEIVLTVGHMEGGSATNIIPDTAFLEGTIRAYNEETRNFVKQRLEEIATSMAKMFRTEATVTYPLSCPSVTNDEKLFYDLIKYNRSMLGDDKVINMSEVFGEQKAKGSGSEDFGFVSLLVPAVSVNVVMGTKKDGYIFANHHPQVRFDEAGLYVGAAVYANSAMSWLAENK